MLPSERDFHHPEAGGQCAYIGSILPSTRLTEKSSVIQGVHTFKVYIQWICHYRVPPVFGLARSRFCAAQSTTGMPISLLREA